MSQSLMASTRQHELNNQSGEKTGGTIIVVLKGGLGNQLYQYAMGRALALRQNGRLLFDASFFHRSRDRVYALDQFQIQQVEFLSYPKARLLHLWVNERHQALKHAIRFAVPRMRIENIVDPVSRVIADQLMASGNLYLSGFWQSPSYFQGYEELIRTEFRFRSEPSDGVKQFAERMAACESVAVHVRRGDYVSNAVAHQIHGICEADYYERAAEIIGERVVSPRFFVFSDDPAEARNMLRLPGPTEFVVDNLGRRDGDDLRLMSHCRHHIIANSSFSWWGAWLAKHDGQVVVAPRAWFREDYMAGHCLEDRIPAEWHTT